MLEMNDEKTPPVDDVGALKSIIEQNNDKQRCGGDIATSTATIAVTLTTAVNV